MFDFVMHNLLTPAVLFFVFGLVAAFLKSDLKFPQGLSETLSIYLLIAIGLKGGIELSKHSDGHLVGPISGALLLGVIIPIITLFIMRAIGLDKYNAIGLAACYGSVSIVTYGAAVGFLEGSGVKYESFMSALVVLMEGPAILVSLLLLKAMEQSKETSSVLKGKFGIVAGGGISSWLKPEIMKESLFGKSVFLLCAGMLAGWMGGPQALPAIKPLFMDLYGGMLLLFLLGMGLQAGQQIGAVKAYGVKLIVAGMFMPIVFGFLGVWVGSICGLSVGGMTLLGVLAGSASYIAAPAALRTSVPQANPSVYLGMALGITFPVNLAIGIPLALHWAQSVFASTT